MKNKQLDQKQKQKILFWSIFILLAFLILIPLINNRSKCLEYQTKITKETYYDFSESGTGITEGTETSHTCIKWDTSK